MLKPTHPRGSLWARTFTDALQGGPLALSFALITLAGCPSDSDNGPTARQQCEALAEDTCDKLVSCASELTDEDLTEADHKNCVESVTSETECSKAVEISDDYPDCIDAIRNATCDDVYGVDDDGYLVVNELPPMCRGVVKVR